MSLMLGGAIHKYAQTFKTNDLAKIDHSYQTHTICICF